MSPSHHSIEPADAEKNIPVPQRAQKKHFCEQHIFLETLKMIPLSARKKNIAGIPASPALQIFVRAPDREPQIKFAFPYLSKPYIDH